MQNHLAAAKRNNGFSVIETVVRTFGFVARSTSLLMTDKLEHREHLRTVVKKARGEF